MNKESIEELTDPKEVSATDEMHTQNRLEAAVDPIKTRAFSRQSQFHPQIKNWAYDLPHNQNIDGEKPKLIWVNEINDVYLEIPRYENIMWGSVWINVITMFPFSLVTLYVGLKLLVKGDFLDIPILLIAIVSFFLFFSFFIHSLRWALFIPREPPIRFNRKRQKIYVYEYQRKWNPYTKWPTVIKIFDWAQVHAEITSHVGRYDQGYRMVGVVCKPDCYEVIDRFTLVWTVSNVTQLSQMWEHCCRYMAKKPVPISPREYGNPNTRKIERHIHWPADIDIESRTAPT